MMVYIPYITHSKRAKRVPPPAMGVENNVRLTTIGAKQLSMVAVWSSHRKLNLPEMRDNDTKTAKVRADGNKHCPGK